MELKKVEEAINRIKTTLRATGEREILSLDVGEEVMKELRELDEVAIVRFASVYRSFKAGRYPHLDKMKPRLWQGVLQVLATKPVRLGAYGDPECDLDTIPILTQFKWTGYTHQWK